MEAVLKDKRINLLFDSKESNEYLVKLEACFPKGSPMAVLLTEHLLGDNHEVISRSDLELEFIEVDANNISESKLKVAFFIVESINGNFTTEITMEALVNSGVLQKYETQILDAATEANLTKMSLPQFKIYLQGKEPKDVFNQILNQELNLSCFPGDALSWTASNGEISSEQLLKFTASEWFSKEYSTLLIEKENFIIEDCDQLIELLKKGISDEAQKVMISRYQQVHPELPVVYSLARLAEIIEEAESYEQFKNNLFHKRMIFAKKDFSPLELLSMEIEALPLGAALMMFIKERQVSDKELTDYIFLEDAVDEINSYIIERTDYIILNHLTLLKVANLPVITEETEEVLSQRYESWFSKDKQSQIAVEFQKYAQEIEDIPNDKVLLSEFIEKSKVLYSLVNQIDPSITKGIFKPGQQLDNCEFDSQGFPLVSQAKMNKVLTFALKKTAAPADLILFYHELECIEDMYRLPPVIEHPNCPLSLLTKYAEDRNSFSSLLRNKALPQEILVKIADQLRTDDTHLFNQILNHPNCSKELQEIIKSNFAGYLNKLETTEDSNYLAEQARKLIVYPTNWKERFDLDLTQKHDALRSIMKNQNTPTFAINQLLEYYRGFESDPEEDMKLLRHFILRRDDCPLPFLVDMVDSGFSSIRMEVITSKHFISEDLIETALDYALNEFMESMGEYKWCSRRVLESDLSPEVQAIIKHSPFPERTRQIVKDKMVNGIKQEVQVASNLEGLKGIYHFLTKNNYLAGVIEIGIELKNELVKEIQDKVVGLKLA